MHTDTYMTPSPNKRTKPNNDNDTEHQYLALTNPLLESQSKILQSFLPITNYNFFSSTHLTPAERSDLWSQQAIQGEDLINRYSWAIPDERCINILKYYSPIVEVGCGKNAYWSRLMRERGVDVIAFDCDLEYGGIIVDTKKEHEKHSDNVKKIGIEIERQDESWLKKGGPEMLSSEEYKSVLANRTLFLCYPDEHYLHNNSDNTNSDDDTLQTTLGTACLTHYTGKTIIHTGELYSDSLAITHTGPWGRSSSPNFQEQLTTDFHCILKLGHRTNWMGVRDSTSVWKRSEMCAFLFSNENEEEEEQEEDGSLEEVEYKFIPEKEMLSMDIAAPCMMHLL